jgi:hypothetical protein
MANSTHFVSRRPLFCQFVSFLFRFVQSFFLNLIIFNNLRFVKIVGTRIAIVARVTVEEIPYRGSPWNAGGTRDHRANRRK